MLVSLVAELVYLLYHSSRFICFNIFHHRISLRGVWLFPDVGEEKIEKSIKERNSIMAFLDAVVVMHCDDKQRWPLSQPPPALSSHFIHHQQLFIKILEPSACHQKVELQPTHQSMSPYQAISSPS